MRYHTNDVNYIISYTTCTVTVNSTLCSISYRIIHVIRHALKYVAVELIKVYS